MTTSTELFDRHRETLDRALTAIRERSYWSAYDENLKAYGEAGPASGKAAFDGYLGRPFPLPGHPGEGDQVGQERSPYGIDLGVTYPHPSPDELIGAARRGMAAW